MYSQMTYSLLVSMTLSLTILVLFSPVPERTMLDMMKDDKGVETGIGDDIAVL